MAIGEMLLYNNGFKFGFQIKMSWRVMSNIDIDMHYGVILLHREAKSVLNKSVNECGQ
jgi:hypothetical protein